MSPSGRDGGHDVEYVGFPFSALSGAIDEPTVVLGASTAKE